MMYFIHKWFMDVNHSKYKNSKIQNKRIKLKKLVVNNNDYELI